MKFGQLLNVVPKDQRINIYGSDDDRHIIDWGTMEDDYKELYEYADLLVTKVYANTSGELTVQLDYGNKPKELFKIDDLVDVNFFLQYDSYVNTGLLNIEMPKFVHYGTQRVSRKTLLYLSMLKDEDIEVQVKSHNKGTPLEWFEYFVYIKEETK